MNHTSADALESYLKAKRPLGDVEILRVSALAPEKGGSHDNFRIDVQGGNMVARAEKSERENANPTDVAAEYAVLRCVQGEGVGPKPIGIDIDGFNVPLLFEEYIEGTPYSEILNLGQEHFNALITLMVRVGQIRVPIEGFNFTNSYSTYQTNFDAWDMRIGEIAKHVGCVHDTVAAFHDVAMRAKTALTHHEDALARAASTFIYNDIHGDNVLYVGDGQAKFVDWQKVSMGDPAFMAAVCAHRMGKLFVMSDEDFSEKVLRAYTRAVSIPNFEELFRARIIERTVSDMTWSIWSKIKTGTAIGDISADENPYYRKAIVLLGAK